MADTVYQSYHVQLALSKGRLIGRKSIFYNYIYRIAFAYLFARITWAAVHGVALLSTSKLVPRYTEVESTRDPTNLQIL